MKKTIPSNKEHITALLQNKEGNKWARFPSHTRLAQRRWPSRTRWLVSLHLLPPTPAHGPGDHGLEFDFRPPVLLWAEPPGGWLGRLSFQYPNSLTLRGIPTPQIHADSFLQTQSSFHPFSEPSLTPLPPFLQETLHSSAVWPSHGSEAGLTLLVQPCPWAPPLCGPRFPALPLRTYSPPPQASALCFSSLLLLSMQNQCVYSRPTLLVSEGFPDYCRPPFPAPNTSTPPFTPISLNDDSLRSGITLHCLTTRGTQNLHKHSFHCVSK